MDVQPPIRTIAACVLNNHGHLLSYTVQPTMQQCEEEAAKRWPWWDNLKRLGCRVVEVEITYVPTAAERVHREMYPPKPEG